MTNKQHLFAEFMLKRIGFQNPERISEYLEKLEQVHGKWFKDSREVTYNNGYSYYQDFWNYTSSPCIEVLLQEIDIKKQPQLIKDKRINIESFVNATDLANYNFCPASYSIGKSFEIEFPTNEDKRITGLELHESLRLLNRNIPEQWNKETPKVHTVTENPILTKIKNCNLIFSGHSDQNLFFHNNKKRYTGQPDYIFQDPNGSYFVVEEKFKYLNSYYDDERTKFQNLVKRTFHSNHIVQLLSYLHYIEDYNLKYGVLIYWFYDFYNNQPYIHHVSTKVIKSDYPTAVLEGTHGDLSKFIQSGEINLSEQINPSKCAACVVNKYCSHKTGEKTNLKFPYDKSILRLGYVEFPEELKRNPDNRR